MPRPTIQVAVLLTAACLLVPSAAAAGAQAGPSPDRSPARVEQELPRQSGLVGRWEVSNEGSLDVVWRSSAPVPVRSAHPVFTVGGRTVAVPTLTSDGHGLAAPLSGLAGVDLPRLEVWLGAERLDRAPTARGRAAAAVTAEAPLAFEDPEVLDLEPHAPGPHEVETFAYRAAPLPTRELVAAMEVRGHVVLPQGVEDAPLVLFLHGRKGACYDPGTGREAVASAVTRAPGSGGQPAWRCPSGTRPIPSHRGFDYLQRLLASQGYATVSVAANAVNAHDGDTPDFGATARGALVRHHLSLIDGWVADPTSVWSGRVDLANTVLVGHSRGGEGVARAAMDTLPASPWSVSGLVLVAPTAPNRLATPLTPTVTLLPYCDGDVVDLTGGQFTDLPRDLTTGDPALHSTVLLRGANHAFFNSEWTPGLSVTRMIDDARRLKHPACAATAPQRLTAAQQRTAAEAWVAAAVHLFASGDETVLPLFDSADPISMTTAPYVSALTNATGGGRGVVRPVLDGGVTGAATACRAALHGAGGASLCGHGVAGFAPRAPHWVYERFRGAPAQHQLELDWDAPGTAGGLALREPLDLAGTRLDLRIIVDPTIRPRKPTRFDVVLEDADGHRWTVPAALHPLGTSTLHTYAAQTVGLDPAGAPVDFDATSVSRLDLVARSDAGRVWLLDAAARPSDLPPVTEHGRLPVLTVAARTKVTEGDAPIEYATVRWSLDEPAPVAARAVIVVLSYARRRTQTPVAITVPQGATSGTVKVPYPAGTNRGTHHSTLLPFAVEGLVVTRPFASLLIKDDD